MDVTKPYEFMGFGAMDGPKPYTLIRFCLGGLLHTRGGGVVSVLHPRFPKSKRVRMGPQTTTAACRTSHRIQTCHCMAARVTKETD